MVDLSRRFGACFVRAAACCSNSESLFFLGPLKGGQKVEWVSEALLSVVADSEGAWRERGFMSSPRVK